MKKRLLGGSALVAATVLAAGSAVAAEPPTYKIGGNLTFQFLYESQDVPFGPNHGYYLAVNDPEIRFAASGVADNGLNYGFKVELNANTSDTTIADEVVAQFGGTWGRLELGDEDGAEDTMQLGAESVMGGSGGIDGSYGMVLFDWNNVRTAPALVGDTSDATKITYYSPNFSGLTAGVSLTPTQHDGQDVGAAGPWEDSIGLGVKYSAEHSGVSVAVSGVYVTASSTVVGINDVSSWSLGGTAGFGAVSFGASYTDSGSSLMVSGRNDSYWNAGVGYSAGPIYLSMGFASYTHDWGGAEATRDVFSLTGDYAVAPGLTTYADVVVSSEDYLAQSNAASILIVGAALTF